MSEKTEEEIKVLLDAYGSAMDFDLESFFKFNWTTKSLNKALLLKHKDERVIMMIKRELKRRK